MVCVGVYMMVCGCVCDGVWVCMFMVCVGVYMMVCGCVCDGVWVCM